MIIFYSGSDSSCQMMPEKVLKKRNPGVMMTYWKLYPSEGSTRWKRLLKQLRKQNKRRAKHTEAL
jgi:hypothetical protein